MVDVFIYKLLRRIKNYMNGQGNADMRSNGELRLLNWVMSIASKEGYVLDIGCHRGEWLDGAISFCPPRSELDYVGVEVNEEFFNLLATKYENISKVRLLKLAITDTVGEKSFYVQSPGTLNSGSDSLYEHHYLSKRGETRSVATNTIDQLVQDLGIGIIHFCKMDIEGAEIPALRGAIKALSEKRINFCQLEYGQTWLKSGSSIENLYEIIEKTDYSLYRIARKSLISFPKNYNYALDDFTFSNVLLVSPNVNISYPILDERRI